MAWYDTEYEPDPAIRHERCLKCKYLCPVSSMEVFQDITSDDVFFCPVCIKENSHLYQSIKKEALSD